MDNSKVYDIIDLHQQPSVDGVIGFNFDIPKIGDTGNGFTLPLAGWVLGNPVPVTDLEIQCNDFLLRSVPIKLPSPDILAVRKNIPGSDRARFTSSISLLGLPQNATIDLVAVFEDGSKSQLGNIKCEHNKFASSYESKFNPLIVTSLGRTGSTWLMRLLSNHPSIIAFPKYPFEVKAATYWMQMLKVLTESGNRFQSTKPVDFEREFHFIGHNPYNCSLYFNDLANGVHLREWFRKDYLHDLVCFTKKAVDDYYSNLCGLCDKTEATFFAEKTVPIFTRGVFRDVYNSLREIILVRDVRDIFCSARAFNRKRGYKTFGEDSAKDDYEWLSRLAKDVKSLLNVWKNSEEQILLVRYEDLLTNPKDTLRSILDYANLDSNEEAIATIIEKASVDTPQLAFHRTSKNPKAAIGRWRYELDESIISYCRENYGALLEDLGYTKD